ncbi:MAG: hypothetical protein LBR22_10210 [Desulfovibrio sp.]|jgi:lysophospholipase L1-like esterase|nr:hypothetical protein [Desulfovibrio sp.]
MQKTRNNIRLFFPSAALRFFAGMLAIVVVVLFGVEQFIQRQTSSSLLNNSWSEENRRIKQSNREKFDKLDETFPLLATRHGCTPLASTASHRIVLLADSFSWGDGLANLNDVWWRQLQRELERRGYHDVEVVSLGWNGAQTKEELSWLRDPRFTDLKADAIVIGYVVNDPDMGLIPQNYKVYRMFFADDVFRFWLPELVEHYQAAFMRKEHARRAAENLSYGPEEWLLLILEGENFRLWTETVAALKKELASKGVPFVYMTLPASPDKAYHEVRYEKPLRVIRESGIPLLDILDDFTREKDKGVSPLIWAANPANGHPGTGTTNYYARKLADYLEANMPQVLGPKGPAPVRPPRVNDWYPWKMQADLNESGLLHLRLPEFREMGVLPVGEPHILVSFERPVNLRQVQLPDAGIVSQVIVTATDPQGLDEHTLIPCSTNNGRDFTVPPLPPGNLVNTLRFVPKVENRAMTAQLTFGDGGGR